MAIRDIHAAGQPLPLQLGGRGKAKDRRQAAGSPGDRVEISPEARRAIMVDQLVQEVHALPEVRPAAVAAARRALESGDLDTQAAIDATVRAIRQSS